jgi:hypothetical protein
MKTPREDDAFTRRVMAALLISLLASVGGWIYSLGFMQSDLVHAYDRIEKLEAIQAEISKSMSSIDKGVEVLIALAEERNKQQKESIKKQNYIFGELKRRSPMSDWVEKQMSRR